MPEMQNLNEITAFVDAVVDQDGCVHELTNAGAAGNRAADVGKVLQKIHVIQKSVAETFRGGGKVGPGIFEDVLQVA
jgi:hypothetical protein